MKQRLAKAKFAYTARNVNVHLISGLQAGDRVPRAGDLVLARVESIGHHKRLERPDGRRATLFPGDEIVVAYGNRYAPDQFEAEVPSSLGACDLVAAGGVAAAVRSSFAAMEEPTRIRPLGLLVHAAGGRATLGHFALPAPPAPFERPPALAVVGTSMNAGKTTAAAHLVRGLRGAGLRVGAAKITGTGAGGDVWLLRDAGADEVLDFTDCGAPSTYMLPLPRLERIFCDLTDHLAARGVDALVLEIADGVYQAETAALLESSCFRSRVGSVLFAAGDAAGAATGARWLRERGLPVGAVTGALTRSPLAMREAHVAAGLPVLDLDSLSDGAVSRALVASRIPSRPAEGALPRAA
jgi:hypothetical protein